MEAGNIWSMLASYRWVIFWLAVIFFFRHGLTLLLASLTSLCNRIKSTTIEFIGIKLGADASLSLGSDSVHDEKFTVFLKAFQSPIVTNEEKVIRTQLAETKCSDNQAISILISQLANRNVLTLLFLIDRWIYEEQIKLLLYLNTNNKICTIDELRKFYAEWNAKSIELKKAFSVLDAQAANHPQTTYEQFLGFLITHELMSQNINGYRITALGRDYLSFIVKAGRKLPQDKIEPTLINDENNQADNIN